MRNFGARCVCAVILMCGLALTGCNKEEGVGGKASVRGKVYRINDDGNIKVGKDSTYSFVRDTVLAVGEDVYIIYGESDDVYDDKTKTSYNGEYKFEYLREGKYKLYCVGDDDTYMKVDVELPSSGETEAPNLYMYDGKNTMKSGIVGRITVNYPKMDYDDKKYGVGARVYLQKDGEITIDDTRADYRGIFYFSKLEPNATYRVWGESEMEKNGYIKGDTIVVRTKDAGKITEMNVELKVKSY